MQEWSCGDLIDDNLRITDILKGGMGIVYITKDRRSHETFALKTIQQQLFWNKRSYDMFIREAEVWVRLEKHPNIVQAHKVKILSGRPYIFLEYIDGSSLEQLIKSNTLTINESVDYSIQFCRGMDYAFKKLGIVHRDIKPSNCLINREGILKISDFGLAGIFSDTGERETDNSNSGYFKTSDQDRIKKTIAQTGAFQGTIEYTAPERLSNPSLFDISSDIYSFGVMLYEMLAGRKPVKATDLASLIIIYEKYNIPDVKKINSKIPDNLGKIVMKCLSKNIIARYSSFHQLGEELKAAFKSNTGKIYVFKDKLVYLSSLDWLNKGLSFTELKQYNEAIECFDEALKLDDKRAEIHIAKGKCLSDLKKFREALSCFEKTLEIEPRNESAWIEKGHVFFVQNRFQDAIFCLNIALEINSHNEAAWVEKAIYYEHFDNTIEGLKCLDEALKINGRSEKALFNKGKMLLKQNLTNKAISLFEDAIQLNPRMPEAWLLKAEALMAQGRMEDALFSYLKVIEIDPENEKALLGQAMSLLNMEEYEKALTLYQKISEKDSLRETAFYQMIIINCSIERYESALVCCNQILKQKPNHSDVLIKKGQILEKLFYFKRAREAYDSAIKHSPDNFDAIKHIEGLETRIQAIEASYEEMLSEKFEIPTTKPSMPNIPDSEMKKFNDFLKTAGKYSGKELLTIGRNAFHNNLQWFALLTIIYSLKKDPEIQDSHFWLGRVFEHLELYDNALDSYSRYLKMIPSSIQTLLIVGEIFQKLGRTDLSLKAMIAALKLNQSNWMLWLMIIKYFEDSGSGTWSKVFALKAYQMSKNKTLTPKEKIYSTIFESVLGRYEKAIKTYDELLRNREDDFFLVVHKLDCTRRLHLYEEANKGFIKYEKQGKNNAFYMYYLALLQSDIMNEDTSIIYLNESIRLDPGIQEPHISRLKIMIKKQTGPDSILMLTDEIPRKIESSNKVIKAKALIMYDSKKFEEALHYIEKGIASNPYDASLLSAKAIIMKKTGRTKSEIHQILDEYRAHHPLEAFPWNMESTLYIEQGDIDKAEKCVKWALSVDHFSSQAWNNLGVISFLRNNPDEALKCFSKALSFNPDSIEAGNNRGCIMLIRKKNKFAKYDFNRIYRLNSKFGWGRYNRSLFLCRERLFRESLKELEKAENLIDEKHNFIINRAICLLLEKRFEEADSCLIKSIKYESHNNTAWFLKALMCIFDENFAESIEFLEHSLTIDNSFSPAWFSLGVSLNALGLLKKGEEALKNANHIQPGIVKNMAKSEFFPDEIVNMALEALNDPVIVPSMFSIEIITEPHILTQEIDRYLI